MSNDNISETERMLREYANLILSMADSIREYPPSPHDDIILAEALRARLNYHGVQMSAAKFKEMLRMMGAAGGGGHD